MTLKIDSSALSAWRRCPTIFNRRYVKGLVPVINRDKLNPAEYGTVFHKALEKLYRTGSAISAKDVIEIESRAILEGADNEAFLGQIKALQALFNAYIEQWENPDITFTVYDQEKYLECPLTPDITYCGTVDALASLTGGNDLIIVDHKTSSSLGYIMQKYDSDQFTGYIWLAQQSKINVDSLLVNGICTAAKVVGNPDQQFTRYVAVRNSEAISSWVERTIRDCNRIIEDIEENKFSEYRESCHDFNHNCDYQEICFCNKELIKEAEKNGFRVELWKNFRLI